MQLKKRTFFKTGRSAAAARVVRACRAEALEPRMMLSVSNWQSSEIGGGGFVTGVLYSPTQQGLVYARTDVGGAYRWDAPVGRWEPLMDFMGVADGNSLGVEGMAIDPQDGNKLYISAGTYGRMDTWGPMGLFYASNDQGRSFSRVTLPFKVAANNEGRGNGERLVVDPRKSNVLYYGAREFRNSAGTVFPAQLWRSTDSGTTWSAVTSFPAITDKNGINFIEFDANSFDANGTRTLYVGVGQMNSTSPDLYKSTDGGTTWSQITGTGTLPSNAHVPMRAALTPDGGTLYLTYGSTNGPGDAWNGGVFRLNTATNVWTNITPSQASTAGYGGIDIDPTNPNIVTVSTLAYYNPNNKTYRTLNGGTSWRDIRTTGIFDSSSAPYAAGVSPHWGNDLKIDPFDRTRGMVVTGNGIWALSNLTAADGATQQPVNWTFNSQNLEETVVSGVISPPVGPSVVRTIGDYGGFIHPANDPVSARTAVRFNPTLGSETSLAFAENAPTVFVRGGGRSPWAYVTTNSGTSWSAIQNPPANVSGVGSIIPTADGTGLVWSPTFSTGNGLYYSNDRGVTWNLSSSPVTRGTLVADRANASKIYLYTGSGTDLYVSTNRGATFTAVPAGRTVSGLYAVPGFEGHLWMTSGSGLWRSTDSGATWSQVASGVVTSSRIITTGKAAAGRTYPALYLYGVVSTVTSSSQFYRSDDQGQTWVRINDDLNQFGFGWVMAGDPRVFGRVYVGIGGAGGRGTLFNDWYDGLPPGWTHTDIGSPARAGDADRGVDPSVTSWVASAGGTGVGGTADQFGFARRNVRGDATAMVRIDRIRNTNNGATGGVMFRDSAAAGSAFAMVAVTPGNGVEFSYRTATGASAGSVSVASPNGQGWVRLVRAGNTFTASYATTTGTPGAGDWVTIGSPQTITMATTALAGLATSSENASLTTSVVYSGLSVGTPPTVATGAAASPSPVAGTTTTLSVLGADPGGEAGLIYTWVQRGGPATAALTRNASNLAKSTTATFTAAGTYTFEVFVDNGSGAVASSVTFVVSQTPTGLAATPAPAIVAPGATLQLGAVFVDQFGAAIVGSAPGATWTLLSGAGTVSGSGLYSAPGVQAVATVRATSGAMSVDVAVTTATPGLVASYSFNENAGTTVADSSGRGGSGTLTSTTFVTGRTGYALSFNGTSSRVSLGSPSQLNVSGQVTLSAWVRASRTTGLNYIVARGSAANPETFLRINAGFYEVGSFNNTTFMTRAAIPTGDLNSWVLLTGTYDGTAWNLYRNGSLVSSSNTSTGALASTLSWTIGASAAPNRFYQGSLDGVRIYNRALSAGEVAGLFSSVNIATSATAASSPVTGTSVAVSVLALDPDSGVDARLSYQWASVGSPPGPVTFSANATNAAKNSVAIFTNAGTYSLVVNVSDLSGATTSSTVNLVVNATPTAITVSPAVVSVRQGTTQAFSAAVTDQFGRAIVSPAVTWSATGGSISAGGVFTPGGTTGAGFLATASTGSVTGSAAVTVLPPSPQFSSLVVNDGAVQRSMVRSLTLTFSTSVVLQGGAVQLARRGSPFTGTVITTPASGAASSYVLTFSGGEIIGGSLADGTYDLTLNPSLIRDAWDGPILGGAIVRTFHRLFGDGDGSGVVNSADLASFNTAFGATSAAARYLSHFDYEQNGVINNADLLQLRRRMVLLPPPSIIVAPTRLFQVAIGDSELEEMVLR